MSGDLMWAVFLSHLQFYVHTNCNADVKTVVTWNAWVCLYNAIMIPFADRKCMNTECINEIKITGLIGHRLERRLQELQHSRSHDKKSVGKRSRDGFDGGRDRPGHMLRKISVALGAVAEVLFSILTVTWAHYRRTPAKTASEERPAGSRKFGTSVRN